MYICIWIYFIIPSTTVNEILDDSEDELIFAYVVCAPFFFLEFFLNKKLIYEIEI